jgi:hypothetical protein
MSSAGKVGFVNDGDAAPGKGIFLDYVENLQPNSKLLASRPAGFAKEEELAEAAARAVFFAQRRQRVRVGSIVSVDNGLLHNGVPEVDAS